MAEWSAQAGIRDRPAGVPEHRLSAVAIRFDVPRLRGWRGGDDRVAIDRRSHAVAGAERETGRWRRRHSAARRTRHRSYEDWRDRRAVLLDRSRVVPVSAGPGFTTLQTGRRCGRSADRGKT